MPPPHMPPTPDLPGELAPLNIAHWLRSQVAQLCHLQNDRSLSKQRQSQQFGLNCFQVPGKSTQLVLLARISTSSNAKSTACSLSTRHLDLTLVGQLLGCEKSDGIRVLFFVRHSNPENKRTGSNTLYAVLASHTQHCYSASSSSHNRLLEAAQGIFFPHHENPHKPLGSTIIDGELVVDTDPKTGQVWRPSLLTYTIC